MTFQGGWCWIIVSNLIVDLDFYEMEQNLLDISNLKNIAIQKLTLAPELESLSKCSQHIVNDKLDLTYARRS